MTPQPTAAPAWYAAEFRTFAVRIGRNHRHYLSVKQLVENLGGHRSPGSGGYFTVTCHPGHVGTFEACGARVTEAAR
jgi:hypothetical protein